MTIERCKNCGAELDITKAVGGVIECEFCGSKHILAKSKDENALNFIKIGEHDLDTCKFADAYEAYNKACQIDADEPEAYFGKALASHRIQYIKDIVNNKLQPVCHDINDKVFTEDNNYKQAIKLATIEQRAEYIFKGNEIDRIKKEFNELKKKNIRYDCFICVKVTDDKTKQRTNDYKTADDLYFLLRGKGYNPFFSEREIQNRTGGDYEAAILYALYTSECMLIVCSDEEYLNTPWVKNEYTRFSAMINDERKERDGITIVFDNIPIEKLPNRQGKIQGINIRDLNATEKIVNYVYNHTPEARKQREQAERARLAENEKIKRQLAEAQRELESKLAAVRSGVAANDTAQANTAVSVQALTQRVRQFLESGDYGGALKYCERILDAEPEKPEAWYMRFLAKNGASDDGELIAKCIKIEDVDEIRNDKNFRM